MMIHPEVVYTVSCSQMADAVFYLSCMSVLRDLYLRLLQADIAHLLETFLKGNSLVAVAGVKGQCFAWFSHFLMTVGSASIPSPNSHCCSDYFI